MSDLVAGAILDALIAEKVMGEPKPASNLSWDRHFSGSWNGPSPSNISPSGNWLATTTGYDSGDEPIWLPKSYSQDIGAAWEVAEKFIAAGCAAWVEGDGHTGYRAGCTTERGRFEAEGKTAPEAICRAALRAVGAPRAEGAAQ